MNKTISHILLNSLLSIATMAIASGQDAQPALTAEGNAGADVQSTTRIASVERAIVDRTNKFRKSNQLDAVQRDEHLMQAAKNFAEFMARTGKYGHGANGMTPAQRAVAADYDYCVVRENIAYRTNTGEVTADSLIEVFVQGWIDSPPHRENML
ncbi:MAG: CAP domain-containing protein, partial [Pirellula staleyi]